MSDQKKSAESTTIGSAMPRHDDERRCRARSPPPNGSPLAVAARPAEEEQHADDAEADPGSRSSPTTRGARSHARDGSSGRARSGSRRTLPGRMRRRASMRRARTRAGRCGSCPCSRDTRGGLGQTREQGSAALLRRPPRCGSRSLPSLIAALAAGCGEQLVLGRARARRPRRRRPRTVDGHDDAAGDHDRVERRAVRWRFELFFLAPDGKLAAASRDVEHTQTPGAARSTS